jgi:hypothetical protein
MILEAGETEVGRDPARIFGKEDAEWKCVELEN